MSSNKHFSGDLDITQSEFDNITKALKNDEFKKLFFDYCQEIQNPESRKKHEEEIIQLEAERGVEVTFLNPEPGFVVKTSVDGKGKGFINISKSDKIAQPTSDVQLNEKTGKRGLNWSIPFAQAPPRNDVDNKGARCTVFDVLFHPDALHLAERNSTLRKLIVDTALDAVEREFNVKLDRTNLKFPKMKFKGVPRPTVIRKKSKNSSNDDALEPSPIDSLYPPIPAERDVKIVSGDSRVLSDYETPKYVIKHRNGVDLAEMTYELDAKLNVTLPKELVVEIELPLLKSTADCTLDVTHKQLVLISEKPAKYKLQLDLPFAVNDKNGSAKFDIGTRKLSVVLPVRGDERKRSLKDLYREDSGVESDVRDDGLSTSVADSSALIEVAHSQEGCAEDNSSPSSSFLKSNIHYNFPLNFDCNVLDEELAVVLHIKNVDPQSIESVKSENFIHLKFTSIGSGYYPTNYAFYFELNSDSAAKISSAEAEAWDNNVILTLSLQHIDEFRFYSVGLDGDHLREYSVQNKISMPTRKISVDKPEKNIEISVDRLNDGKKVEIEIKPIESNESDEQKENATTVETANENKKSSAVGKKQKKKNKKRRSYSESSCDDFKTVAQASNQTLAQNETNNSDSSPDRAFDEIQNSSPARKQRSFSENHDSGVPCFKSILKRNSRYDRNYSESCSSIDDQSSYSCSIDVMRTAESFSDIPEENLPSHDGLSESCKKTVRFNEVIQKQLFRLDSSILGQRKKNQKRKNQKQRALQRRNSEGDSADYEDNKSPRGTNQYLNKNNNKKLTQHDSGVDLSSHNKESRRNRIDSESDFESKNSLMFDMEM